MSCGIKGRHEGNVFRLIHHTKSFLTELVLIKVAMSVCQKNFSLGSLAAIWELGCLLCFIQVCLFLVLQPHTEIHLYQQFCWLLIIPDRCSVKLTVPLSILTDGSVQCVWRNCFQHDCTDKYLMIGRRSQCFLLSEICNSKLSYVMMRLFLLILFLNKSVIL